MHDELVLRFGRDIQRRELGGSDAERTVRLDAVAARRRPLLSSGKARASTMARVRSSTFFADSTSTLALLWSTCRAAKSALAHREQRRALLDQLPELRVNLSHAARERHADPGRLGLVDLDEGWNRVGPRAGDRLRGFRARSPATEARRPRSPPNHDRRSGRSASARAGVLCARSGDDAQTVATLTSTASATPSRVVGRKRNAGSLGGGRSAP